MENDNHLNESDFDYRITTDVLMKFFRFTEDECEPEALANIRNLMDTQVEKTMNDIIQTINDSKEQYQDKTKDELMALVRDRFSSLIGLNIGKAIEEQVKKWDEEETEEERAERIERIDKMIEKEDMEEERRKNKYRVNILGPFFNN